MSDLGPMDPCPVDKKGRHELSAVIPSDDDGFVTLFCDHCGAVRRMPVSGALGPLDSLAASEIEAAAAAAWRAR